MKNWTKNFIEDMKHIWREFRRDIAETNAKKSHCDDDMAGIGHSASWNNLPDLDPQNPINSLDNFYSRQLRGTDNPGTRYQHRN
ncbi:hypothetical protein ABKM94_003256 [Escherichia coli]|nr:hypothetical protein [Salmonella enterica subsp. enterica serovar Enteritidis]HAE0501710.1 hypothetical protein [Salmonella enterica subsp. enterica serovar Typhimurium]HCK5273817.1 hypothetical protein [Salmonella enterica subsp. enterica serovar Typhimurium]HCK5292992.1 hypothetical protein [Salmonella enterica subsp. enterica serovar Typhimurium]